MNAFFAWLPIGVTLSTMLLFGCATPTGTVQTHVIQTSWDSPVKITRIYLGYSDNARVQSAAGYFWVTQAVLFSPRTIKIDQKSNEVTELSRPRSAATDFLVDENSIWYTDGATLSAVDIGTNYVTATLEDVGIPFAFGDGAVWTYNPNTRVVSGIDANTNQIRTQLPTQGRPYHPGSFAYGAGSIWQFAYAGSVTLLQDRNIHAPAQESIVRRIDPHTKKVIAEIPVGLFTNIVDASVSPDRIHFVAGAIWVLGRSATETFSSPSHKTPFAKRIDVETNQVTATIRLEPNLVTASELNRSAFALYTGCRDYSKPKTPVFLEGGVWISMYCGWSLSALLKIDLEANQITEEFVLRFNHPDLAATERTLWGFGWDSAIRVDF